MPVTVPRIKGSRPWVGDSRADRLLACVHSALLRGAPATQHRGMSGSKHFAMSFLTVAVAALAGVASFLGVFARGDGSFVDVTSPRGVTYQLATTGVYAYNSHEVVAEGVGWDVFTLLVAVPALLIVSYLMARRPLAARLAAIGLFGYFLYQYLEYSVTWAFGPLFPVFIVIYSLSLAGIVWFGVETARDGVADRFNSSYPRRSLAVLNLTMASLLALLWIGRIATGLGGDLAATGIEGQTTLVVQALDLGLVVPTALFVAYLVWRGSAAGMAIGAAYVVTAVAMSAALVAMMVSASIANGDVALPPIVIFGVFTVWAAWIAARIYRGILERAVAPSSERTPAGEGQR